VWWTWYVEDVFRAVRAGNKQAMKELAAKLTQQIRDLVAMMLKPLERALRNKVDR